MDKNHPLFKIVNDATKESKKGKYTQEEFNQYFDELIKSRSLKWYNYQMFDDSKDVIEWNVFLPVHVMEQLMPVMETELSRYFGIREDSEDRWADGCVWQAHVVDENVGRKNGTDIVRLNETISVKNNVLLDDAAGIAVDNEHLKDKLEGNVDESVIEFYNKYLETKDKYNRYLIAISVYISKKGRRYDVPNDFKEKYSKYTQDELIEILYNKER